MTTIYETLDDLFADLQDGSYGGDWTDCPTFGGSEPDETSGIWSWDEGRLIVGPTSGELRLISREDYEWERAERRRGPLAYQA